MGCYYLHENGELIFKSAGCFLNMTPMEYFDSPFVVKWWPIPKKSPTESFEENVIWVMNWLREAYELSAQKEITAISIRRICNSQQFPDMIANAIIEGKKASVLRDESLDLIAPMAFAIKIEGPG